MSGDGLVAHAGAKTQPSLGGRILRQSQAVPEGDAIYRYAVRLRADLVDRELDDLVVRHRGSIDAARGRRVSAIATRGKHTLIHVDQMALHIHLGMNGGWRRFARNARRRGGLGRDAAIVATAECEWRCHRAMRAEILEGDAVASHRSLARLGPDLLGDEVDWAEILRRARQPERERAAIADVLLEQQVAAGIGTIYRSETLFVARQNPWAPMLALSDERVVEIYQVARRLLSMNLVPGRATRTTEPGRRRAARRELETAHYVYTRGGEPCLECGETVEVRRHSDPARKTYYCRRCQIEAPRAAAMSRE